MNSRLTLKSEVSVKQHDLMNLMLTFESVILYS